MLVESTKDLPDDINVITICDREGDFFELYSKLNETDNDFIIRVKHNRASDTDEKVINKIRKTTACGNFTINVPRDTRANKLARQAEMEVAYCSVNIKKPANLPEEKYPQKLKMNIVRITEVDNKTDSKIEWILATSLPIYCAEDAHKIVEFYVQRWKCVCQVKSATNVNEKVQQRSYEKIKPVLLIYSVIAVYIMTVTFIGRLLPDTPCNVFFDDCEWKTLYKIANKTSTAPSEPYSMADAVNYLGQLGGYKHAPSDGVYGLKVVWKGLLALYQFVLFAELVG